MQNKGTVETLDNTAAMNGAATATAYAEKLSEAASGVKEYISDKAEAVSNKLKEIPSTNLSEIKDSACGYARKNPGRAILFSVAAGVLLGLAFRTGRS